MGLCVKSWGNRAIPKMAVAYPCRLNIAGMSFSGASESFCLPINAGCLPLINPVRLGTQVEPDE